MRYDDTPYDSRAVPLTHPSHLAPRAIFHGLHPAWPEQCRVLELGCAEGANLLAMAFHLMEATFIGVDASREQIERGKENRDRLAVDNLELIHADILTLDDDLGTFDYIICHGVLSWVDEKVRRRIFHICKKHLAPQGAAYISYNCATGWSIKQNIRRALMRRTRDADGSEEKLKQIEILLTMLAENPLKETAYGALLAGQSAAALEHRGAYLIHEYLSPQNQPFYFGEIVEMAKAHDLAFLAELTPAVADNQLENQIREGFSALSDDPIEVEELTDLLLFRSFRATLFCHPQALPEEPVRFAFSDETSRRFFFAAPLRPESKRLSLEPDVNEIFISPSGVKISAGNPVLKTALMEIGRSFPKGLSIDDIIQRAELILELRRVLQPGQKIEADEINLLRKDMLELHRLGHVELRLLEPEIVLQPTETPKVAALTRLEAARGNAVTNAYHQVVILDPFTRRLIHHLDGTRKNDELAERMLSSYRNGDFDARDEDGGALEPETLEEKLPSLLKEAIESLAANALLWS